MNIQRLFPHALLCFIILSASVAASAQDQRPPAEPAASDTFFTPLPHQFDLELSDNSMFQDGSSLIRRREASIPGSALGLKDDLGVETFQMPELQVNFWFDELNAIQFQFRYLWLYGSAPLNTPVTFNGQTIAPGQRINTDGTTWFTAGLFYERRISPWLYDHAASNLPEFLRGWDLRPKIGLEFVYLDFQINNAHPKTIAPVTSPVVMAAAPSLDVRGRWHDQELPVPTVGIDARRHLEGPLDIEITAQGTWINKWNSLRNEGGTVYLSQSTFETHWRVIYDDPNRLWGIKPFLGWSYYYYKQAETSGEIGNLVRLQSYGPEVGASYSF